MKIVTVPRYYKNSWFLWQPWTDVWGNLPGVCKALLGGTRKLCSLEWLLMFYWIPHTLPTTREVRDTVILSESLPLASLCTSAYISPMQNFPNWNHTLCFPWNVQAICHNSVWVWAISLWIGAYQFLLLLFVLWGRRWGSPRPPTLSLSDQTHTELFSINNERRFWKMYSYLYFYWIFHLFWLECLFLMCRKKLRSKYIMTKVLITSKKIICFPKMMKKVFMIHYKCMPLFSAGVMKYVKY